MAEWLKAHAWKACIGETLSRVRIPLSPPFCFQSLTELGQFWWAMVGNEVLEYRLDYAPKPLPKALAHPRELSSRVGARVSELRSGRTPGCATWRGQFAPFLFLWYLSECCKSLRRRSPPMPESLPALEAQRTHLLRQIGALGDLRPGSISAVVRRCGKPTCHCAKPNDSGHDPQLRLTRTVKGKTVAESFTSP